jgi:phospholipid-binding lipoprotein MlaA
MMKIKKLTQVAGLMASLLFVSSNSFAASSNSVDPFETYNRGAYRFNKTIDQVALKPVAKVYNRILPGPAKKGVANFFDNLAELPTVANEVLQANFMQAANNSWRFVINSTIGVLGLFDVASHIGLHKYSTDFGITVQRWGLKPTPYLVLPILGPSTITDALALPVNYQFTVFNYTNPKSFVYGARIVNVVSTRAEFLKYGNAADVSLDPYVFQRNAYTQQRSALLQKAKGNTIENLEAGYDFADTDAK